MEKASILNETLPWLETYAGKIVVIKYGGNAMIDDDLKRAFAQDIVFMKRLRHPSWWFTEAGLRSRRCSPGSGSPQNSAAVSGPPARSHRGRAHGAGRPGRKGTGRTDQRRVAVGLSGEDGGLFIAGGQSAMVDGEVDLGLVRDVVSVRTEAVEGLISSGSVPVVAGIAPDLTAWCTTSMRCRGRCWRLL